MAQIEEKKMQKGRKAGKYENGRTFVNADFVSASQFIRVFRVLTTLLLPIISLLLYFVASADSLMAAVMWVL